MNVSLQQLLSNHRPKHIPCVSAFFLALGLFGALVVTTQGAWTELSYDDFESGWGSYVAGGSDCLLYTGGSLAHQGNNAADIQDNSGVASSFALANGIDVATPGYTELKVEFWYYPRSMDNANEDFWLQYWDGASWQTLRSWVKGTDFENGSFYSDSVTINSGSYTFPTDMNIRFMCDASGNIDDIYIDEIRISGYAPDLPANTPPVATDDGGVTVTEDVALDIAVLANDSDPENDPLTITSATVGALGVTAINGSQITYTPTADATGADSFSYIISDGSLSATATVSLMISAVNDAPVFGVDPINKPSATEDVVYADSLASLAADVDAGDVLSYSKVSGPAWLTIATDGTLSGTPSNGDVGANMFVVKVEDEVSASDTATLSISIANVNDAPVFGAASYVMPNASEASAYSDSIATYAGDVDAGDMLSFSKVSGASWLSVASDGSLSGTPVAVDVGVNYFSVQVSDGSLTDNADLEITVDAAPSGGSELLVNGDFEIGTPTADLSALFDASPWQRYIINGNNNSWVTDDTFDPVVGAGNQCVELRWGATYLYQSFAAIEGEDYTISCESLQLSGNQRHVPTLQVEWYDSSNGLIGAPIDVDSVAAADTGTNANEWVAMSNIQAAPAGAVEGRVKLILNTNASGIRKNCFFDNVSVLGASVQGEDDYIGTNAVTEAWSYNEINPATLTAVSQLAGLYAMGNRIDDSIEITDINGAMIATITSSMIQATAADLNLYGEIGGPCSLAFSPSGRTLFIGICSASGSGDKDAILMYNFNLDTLTVFDRLIVDSTLSEPVNYGMVHYKGELFVGTENSLERYAAGRNDTNSAPSQTLATATAITGLTVDMAERTGSAWTPKLYASTATDLYRIDPSVTLNLGSSIASGNNIKAVTFGRTYGGALNGGLYVLENNGSTSTVRVASTTHIRNGGTISLDAYKGFGPDLSDIAATACGRMLLAETSPEIMSDSSDARMDFNTWMADEFGQYMMAIKTLVADDSASAPEGFLIRKIVNATGTKNTQPIADNVGWALYLLMAGDMVTPDPANEQLIELLLQRHVGEHPDGLGGVQTVDGTYARVYNSDGTVAADPQAQVYVSMKMLPAAYKAAELYPSNANIAAYKEKIRSTFKRASDTINAEKHITWTMDDHGPVNNDNGMSNETWLFGDIGAAQDPMCSLEYYDYVYDREAFDYDYWLASEPVIRASHSAFIVMGSSMILRHHYDEPGWAEQNRNYYAVTCAASDDLGAPYFAAFSAGATPNNGYSNDGPSQHPDNVIHFPALLGLGQQNRYSPMIGAYLAYRDGLRQDMQDGISMLTRWSFDEPDYEMASVGIADFWFGGVGLAEALNPGTLNILRGEFFRPQSFLTVENTKQVVNYSMITPRRILGSNDQTNWVSYGFQLSPFTQEYGDTYTYYGIAQPEGELLDVPNGDFEDGIAGWTQTGDYSFLSPSIAGISMVGTSAEIRPTAQKISTESSLSQTLDMSLDLESTEYIIRADGNSGLVAPDGQSYLRVEWDNDSDAGNGVLTTEESNVLSAGNERVEFRIDTLKPAGATHLHIYCVAEMGIPIYDRYIFDNVSMVRLGAKATLANGDFENGLDGWTKSSVKIDLIIDPAKAIDGTSLLWSVGPGLTGWKKATYSFDMSSDPVGTRYIFSFDAKAMPFTDSQFEISALLFDAASANVVTRSDITDVGENTNGERRFTLRKRPEYDRVDIEFRMRRNSSDSLGTDEVVIDNLRLKKEQLF